MAIAINKRTMIYAGAGAVVLAAAAGWFLFLRDDGSPAPQAKAPPPVAKAAPKAPEAPKPPADAAKPAASPEPSKPVAAATPPKPEAKAEPKPEPKVEAPAPVAAAAEPRKVSHNPKRKEDARHCLDQSSNAAIIKCAEEYL